MRTTDCNLFLGIHVWCSNNHNLKLTAGVWNKDVFPNTSAVLNPIMHKSNGRRQTQLLCVNIFEHIVEHKHSTVFSLPFLHLFYEKINVYSEQGAIHPLNYLSLPLWCLTGTSAMILLHRTAVGDSRSLWVCHVHNISEAKRRWRIRGFLVIFPIPSLKDVSN